MTSVLVPEKTLSKNPNIPCVKIHMYAHIFTWCLWPSYSTTAQNVSSPELPLYARTHAEDESFPDTAVSQGPFLLKG